MKIRAHPAEYADLKAMRDLYRQELNCQIVHYSFLPRGLADPYVIELDGRIAGYGAISNKYDKGKLVEFYATPSVRRAALLMFQELLVISQATHIEAQTNFPLMLSMLYDCAENLRRRTCSLTKTKWLETGSLRRTELLSQEEDSCAITIRPTQTFSWRSWKELDVRASAAIWYKR